MDLNYKEVGKHLLEYLKTYGEYSWLEPPFDEKGVDLYKPLYRCMALLMDCDDTNRTITQGDCIIDGDGDHKGFCTLFLDGQIPSLEDARKIVIATHPVIRDNINTPYNARTFKQNYRFHLEAIS